MRETQKAKAVARKWDGIPPVNADQDGWHWLYHGDLTPAFWNAAKMEWQQGGLVCGGSASAKFIASDHFTGGVQYIAPCHMPEVTQGQ